jgi:hypothetical protein
MCSLIMQPLCIWLESCHNIWRNHVFCIPKRVNILEKGINQERVQHVSFKSACGAYKKVHLLVPKKNEKYCYTMYAMIINRNTLDNGRTLPTV